MAKRRHQSIDDVQKFTGASPKSKPLHRRVLALAAVRHDKISPLLSAQEKAQSDVTKAGRIQTRNWVTDCIQKEQDGEPFILRDEERSSGKCLTDGEWENHLLLEEPRQLCVWAGHTEVVGELLHLQQ